MSKKYMRPTWCLVFLLSVLLLWVPEVKAQCGDPPDPWRTFNDYVRVCHKYGGRIVNQKCVGWDTNWCHRSDQPSSNSTDADRAEAERRRAEEAERARVEQEQQRQAEEERSRKLQFELDKSEALKQLKGLSNDSVELKGVSQMPEPKGTEMPGLKGTESLTSTSSPSSPNCGRDLQGSQSGVSQRYAIIFDGGRPEPRVVDLCHSGTTTVDPNRVGSVPSNKTASVKSRTRPVPPPSNPALQTPTNADLALLFDTEPEKSRWPGPVNRDRYLKNPLNEQYQALTRTSLALEVAIAQDNPNDPALRTIRAMAFSAISQALGERYNSDAPFRKAMDTNLDASLGKIMADADVAIHRLDGERFNNLLAELKRLAAEGLVKPGISVQEQENTNQVLHQRLEAARLRERQAEEAKIKVIREAAYQKLRAAYQRLARENGLASEVLNHSKDKK